MQERGEVTRRSAKLWAALLEVLVWLVGLANVVLLAMLAVAMVHGMGGATESAEDDQMSVIVAIAATAIAFVWWLCLLAKNKVAAWALAICYGGLLVLTAAALVGRAEDLLVDHLLFGIWVIVSWFVLVYCAGWRCWPVAPCPGREGEAERPGPDDAGRPG